MLPKETFFNLDPEKQEKVMRSAISEFVKKGFEKSNVGSIAKSAGIAKGSIYQYFENKKELFTYSVKWSMDLLMNKYDIYIKKDNDVNILKYYSDNFKMVIKQIKSEREIAIFLQDVFFGKYGKVEDKALQYMERALKEYTIYQIQQSKKNGYLRNDIDDELIYLFVTGASFKFEEYFINKAKEAGSELIDEDFENFEVRFKNFLDLLKNGIGPK